MSTSNNEATVKPSHFIRQIIEQDLKSGKHGGRVVTRFPPEPNGYLHIGHAKAICLNFGVARDYGGHCSLRFDDTNPLKESTEYVEAIQNDIRWLGFDWQDHLHYASDYFAQLYEWAIELIKADKAYVDSQSAEQIRVNRGTLTEPGTDSPYRDRSVAGNLDLFQRMKAGEFVDGTHVLRAKIDMASANINMRDPVLYRIRHAHHHRTGDQWCIYPMYDFTHGLSDAIEGVTHSLCTLEFEDHRPLYDWFIDNVSAPSQPRQYEYSRLNLDYTVMSKRRLNALVNESHVDGWDDPRMPTISAMRRRGYTAAAIRDFCERIGITKQENRIELSLLENCVRENLDPSAPRAFAVLRPLKVVIENYPQDQVEQLQAPVHPKDPTLGMRTLPFSREIYIERDDFMEDPPKKFFRLGPGREVRLRYGYIIQCNEVIRNAAGEVIELRCSYDPTSRSSEGQSNRKVKGVIHWLSVAHAVKAEIRLYDRLFSSPHPDSGNFVDDLNADSVEILREAWVEPGLAQAEPESRYQFERLGYFCADRFDCRPDRPVFNRTVTLRDSWAKVAK
jgi:glutaminyl-tRNA synthetase